MKKFVTIGHITNDTEPIDHLGGGVSYAAIAAKRLGCETHIITKCPPNHQYVADLRAMGIKVHVLPSQRATITTFQNTYDAAGRRTQHVPEQQEKITKEDFATFPTAVLQNASFFVATVLGEVDTRVFPFLAKFGKVALAPQGYFRKISDDGTVEQTYWVGQKTDLALASIIFSEEDITMHGEINHELLEKFKHTVPLTIMTQGENGSTIYAKNDTFSVYSLSLAPNEIVDLTGAGDTYATAFLVSSQQTNNLRLAASNASFYAALKIIGLGGFGIDAIPTKIHYEEFIAKNKNRITEFLQKNHIETLTLFTEY